ncbi:MAG: hypothetical protein QOF49_1071, partial [Chloroflexota bacterium]|nr:hypothetical protein [Chloroflexota bacterium]
PRLLGAFGRDLLIVDNKNVVWRWRPSDTTGKGVMKTVRVAGAAGWGDDVLAIGTFVKLASEGLYSLYVVDPSEENILAYSPASDGSGFPSSPQKRLAVARDMSKVSDLMIDGDIFVVDAGKVVRFVGGKSEGWTVAPAGATTFSPDGDTLLRPAPSYERIATGTEKRVGLLYAWDRASGRVVGIDKAKGTFVEQYRLAGGNPAWNDIRGMYVVPGADAGAPATLVWATKDVVLSAVLEAAPDGTTGPAPSGSAGASPPAGSPGASSAASAKPSAAP